MGKGGFKSSFFIDCCASLRPGLQRGMGETGSTWGFLERSNRQAWGSHTGPSVAGLKGVYLVRFLSCVLQSEAIVLPGRFLALFSPGFPRLSCPPHGNSLDSALSLFSMANSLGSPCFFCFPLVQSDLLENPSRKHSPDWGRVATPWETPKL